MTTYANPTQLTLAVTVARAKRQILEDVAANCVPRTVASFSELHEHVDANEYGWVNGGPPVDIGNEDGLAFWNLVQDTLDAWIKAKGIGEHLPVYDIVQDGLFWSVRRADGIELESHLFKEQAEFDRTEREAYDAQVFKEEYGINGGEHAD